MKSAPLTHTVKINSASINNAISPVVTSGSRPINKPILLRHVIGEQLRLRRQTQRRTLREVSRSAQVSLGYLSEVERGQKEASSELLASICNALDASLSDLLIDVSAEVARREAKFETLVPLN